MERDYMENEIYLKKFFIDTYNDPNMYYEYLSGRLHIDRIAFSKWYSTMESRNASFLALIKNCNKINTNTNILETALSDNLTVTTPVYRNRVIEVHDIATPKIEMLDIGNETCHYICNGCYETTLQNIYQVLSKGSFTVGICCDKKTDEFRDLVKYYNMLKDFLMRKGYHASSFESNVSSKTRIYLLSYDSKYHSKK
jgi:hypothetical protein